MNIQIVNLIFDFGMLIMIWLVQIIIYPSFKYYQRQGLLEWQSKYVYRITYIVMPLMIGQLSLVIVQVVIKYQLYNIIVLLLILGVWISTFLQFVPLHNRISFGETDIKSIDELINKNWVRTILVTLVFCIDFFINFI